MTFPCLISSYIIRAGLPVSLKNSPIDAPAKGAYTCIGASKNSIVFTKSATESINLVAESWGYDNLKSGDVVLLTDMEHHSNIIPWQIICNKTGAKIKYLKSTEQGTINLDDLRSSLDKNVKMVSITHASNVFGTINPIKEITNIVKKNAQKIINTSCNSRSKTPPNIFKS